MKRITLILFAFILLLSFPCTLYAHKKCLVCGRMVELPGPNCLEMSDPAYQASVDMLGQVTCYYECLCGQSFWARHKLQNEHER